MEPRPHRPEFRRQAGRTESQRLLQPQPQPWPNNEEYLPAARDLRLLLVCKIIGIIITNVLVWLLWKPLGAFTTLMLVGYLRSPLQGYALFWGRVAGMIVGLVLGTCLAALVWVLVHFAVQSVWAKGFFVLQGFLATGYVGEGINPMFRTGLGISSARSVASLAYLATTALILLLHVVTRP